GAFHVAGGQTCALPISAGEPNWLMSPPVATAGANHNIGDITRGFFKDMGWIMNDEEAPALIASPGSISEELFVGDGTTYNIEVSDRKSVVEGKSDDRRQ